MFGLVPEIYIFFVFSRKMGDNFNLKKQSCDWFLIHEDATSNFYSFYSKTCLKLQKKHASLLVQCSKYEINLFISSSVFAKKIYSVILAHN